MKIRQKINPTNGITIITLVITIVIMLILVGVGAKIAIDGDLINITEQTVEKTNNKVSDQQSRVNELTAELDEVIENQITEATAGVRVKKKNLPYYADGKTAIIPKGFTVSGEESEKSIENGLVIYLIPEDVTINWEDEDEVLEAKKTYDQFVWVPVDNINEMYMCQSEGTDIDGSGTVEDDEKNSCNIMVENGQAICKTHNSTLMSGRIRNVNSYASFTKEPTIITGDGTQYDAVLTNLQKISTILGTTEGYESAEDFENLLQTEYNYYVKSIYNNKGFWVGRYETSNMKKANENVIVRVVAGTTANLKAGDWYHKYAQQKNYASNNMLDTIKSGMIQSVAWDQMLDFVDTEEYDTTEAGNVAHDLTTYYQTGGLNYPTDASVEYKDYSKNIYDLEGNVEELTIAGMYTNRRACRGKNAIHSAPANELIYNGDPTTSDNIGSRLMLIIH